MSSSINYRCGSMPKSIGFTASVTPRKFEYQNNNYNNNNYDKANLTERKTNNDPRLLEYSGFRKIKFHEQPDTKRTLFPELAPPQKLNRISSCKNIIENNDGNFRSLLAKTANEEKITDSRKGVRARVYSSFVLSDNPAQAGEPRRRTFKEPQFIKYGATTQIMNLPGGVKRKEIEIKDDEKLGFKKLNHANCSKLIKDFKSSIDCLPGRMIHEPEKPKTRVSSAMKYETNDIFNNKFQNNLTQKKTSVRIRSNLESSKNVKKFVEQTKSKRPENIKNVFKSQIDLSYK